MRKAQPGGVQHQARRGPDRRGQGAAIAHIPDQRPPQMRHMHPQLVHPSGQRLQLHHRPVIAGGQGAVSALRPLRARRIEGDDPHIGFAPDLFAAQRRIHRAGSRLGRRRQQSQILLPEPPHLQRLAQEPRRRLGLGRQDYARGVAIQPMHQFRPLAVRPRERPQQIVQRMRLDPPPLAGQAAGFGKGDDMRILVDHPRTDGGDFIFGQGDGLAVGHPGLLEVSRPPRPQRRPPPSAPASRPSAPAAP